MIIANFNSLQFWGALIFTNIVSTVLTHVTTRQFSHPYVYTRPRFSWNRREYTGWLVYECTDYRGRSQMITKVVPSELGTGITYLVFWNTLLTDDIYVLVQRNGALFSLNASATERWLGELQEGQDAMPLVLKLSSEIDDKLLDGVDLAHHYRRLLAIGDLRGKLVICRLGDGDPAVHYWLLIYVNQEGKRRQLKLAREEDVAEASRLAVLAIMQKANRPQGGQWEQATDL